MPTLDHGFKIHITTVLVPIEDENSPTPYYDTQFLVWSEDVDFLPGVYMSLTDSPVMVEAVGPLVEEFLLKASGLREFLGE